MTDDKEFEELCDSIYEEVTPAKTKRLFAEVDAMLAQLEADSQ